MIQPSAGAKTASNAHDLEDAPISAFQLRKSLVRGVSIVALLALAGCSSVPDYLNPVEWYEDAEEAVTDWWDEDDEKAVAAPPSAPASTQGSSDETYPKLSSVPDKPTGTATQKELEEVKKGLMADKANAKYTDEAEQPKITSGAAPAPQAPKTAAATTATAVAAGTPLTPRATSPSTGEQLPISSPEVVKKAADPDTPSFKKENIVAPVREGDVPSQRLKSADPDASKLWPNTSAPISVGVATVQSQRIDTSASKPRTSMLSEQTNRSATASSISEQQDEPQVAAAAPSSDAMPKTMPAAEPMAKMESPAASADQAGSQSVIVNPDAIYDSYVPTESYEIGVVNFGHGSAHLSGRDKQIIAQSVAAWKERGGRIRIVGHSSSRTGDMDLANHMLANLNISLKRANNVASEMIRQGVDPQYLMVDARGDSEPRYYEVMPAGEAGNRRAEIFIDY